MKNVTLRFRCSEDEAAQMRQRATEANRTLSEWIRSALCEPSIIVAGDGYVRTEPAEPGGTIKIDPDHEQAIYEDARISPDHRDAINKHRATREFRPYPKATQTGRKPK